jgi:hypothetical protein
MMDFNETAQHLAARLRLPQAGRRPAELDASWGSARDWARLAAAGAVIAWLLTLLD